MHLNNGLDIPPRNRDILETSILEILRTYNASMWLAGPGNGEGNYVDSLGVSPRTTVNELVGYVQDEMSSEQAENAACNTEFAGATVGMLANALPGYAGVNTSGLQAVITEVGSGYVNVRFFGTATVANDYLIMEPLATVSKAIAVLNEEVTAAITISYAPGAANVVPRTIALTITPRDGANVPVGGYVSSLNATLTEEPKRCVVRARIAQATAAVATISFRVLAIQIGDVFDFTLRLSDYRISKGNSDTPVKNTALTPLYRTNNYVSLNQSTTGFKPILAGNYLSYARASHTLNNWTITGGYLRSLYADYNLAGNKAATTIERTSAGIAFMSVASTKPSAVALSMSVSFLVKPILGRFFTVRLQGLYPARADIEFDFLGGVSSTVVASVFTVTKSRMTRVSAEYWLCQMVVVTDTNASATAAFSLRSLSSQADDVDVGGVGLRATIDSYAVAWENNYIDPPFPVIPAITPAYASQAPYSWKFDGVDDRLVIAKATIDPNVDHFKIVAYKSPAVAPGTNQHLVSNTLVANGTTAACRIFLASAYNIVCMWRDAAAAQNFVDVPRTQPNERGIITARKVGANYSLKIRSEFTAPGTNNTAVALASMTTDTERIGCHSPGGVDGSFGAVDIYGVISGNGNPTAGEILALENFLAGHAGFVPLP